MSTVTDLLHLAQTVLGLYLLKIHANHIKKFPPRTFLSRQRFSKAFSARLSFTSIQPLALQ